MLLTVLGFVLVYFQMDRNTPSTLLYAVIFVVLFAIAHLGVRFLAPKADPYLLPLTALLSAIGIVFIFRLKAVWPSNSHCGSWPA